MKKTEQRIAIYSRKSRFTGRGESVENQVEMCRAYIQTHYGQEAADGAVIFEDEGFSGGNLNRPGFKRMMSEAKGHQVKAVVVYRLDRISRNISDFSHLIEELSRLDVDFISIREQFDTGSPMGRAMMFISSVFSQLERETIAERIQDNMYELAKTGRWLGGVTPTGYASESVMSVTVDGKSKKASKLVLVPEEAELVRQVFSLFAETDSLTAVEAELLRQHVKTKTGRDFTRFSIKNILQNPVYLIADGDAYQYFLDKEAKLFAQVSEFDEIHGILAYNRTDQEKGRSTIYLPVNEWIISVGEHPGLIRGKDWIKVQESLERNKSKGYRKPRSNEALLTGLIFCVCGNRMYPKLSGRINADGKPVYTYVCKLKERSQRSRCNLHNASGNALDMAVVEEIKGLSGDGSTFMKQLEKSRKDYTSTESPFDGKIEELRRERMELEKKITGLVDSLSDLPDGEARKRVAERIGDLDQRGKALDNDIAEWERVTTRNPMGSEEFSLLVQLLSVFRDSIDAMSLEQKRSAIRTLIRKVVWDGEYAHVYLFGAEADGPATLPLPMPPLGEDSK